MVAESRGATNVDDAFFLVGTVFVVTISFSRIVRSCVIPVYGSTQSSRWQNRNYRAAQLAGNSVYRAASRRQARPRPLEPFHLDTLIQMDSLQLKIPIHKTCCLRCNQQFTQAATMNMTP
jgi:hypothetical protein